MTETAIKKDFEPEIDEELLAEAQRHLDERSRNATLNAALRLFVEEQRDRRGRAFDRLQELADEGGLDFTAIDEADR